MLEMPMVPATTSLVSLLIRQNDLAPGMLYCHRLKLELTIWAINCDDWINDRFVRSHVRRSSFGKWFSAEGLRWQFLWKREPYACCAKTGGQTDRCCDTQGVVLGINETAVCQAKDMPPSFVVSLLLRVWDTREGFQVAEVSPSTFRGNNYCSSSQTLGRCPIIWSYQTLLCMCVFTGVEVF